MKSKSVPAGAGNAEQEVARSDKTPQQLSNGLNQEEIRQRAYEIHVERGDEHGLDVENWLQVERELEQKYKAI